MLFLWTLWSIIAIFFLEHVLSFDGLGFDGVVYAKIIKGFPDILLNRELNSYYTFRTLPSILIWSGLQLLQADISTENIIKGFMLLNYLSISGLLILLFLIVRIKNYSDYTFYFICTLLIMNTAVLKFTYFIPVLTDSFALFIGGVMLYVTLTRKIWLLCLAIFAGIFTWPISAYCGLLLLATSLGGKYNFSKRFAKFIAISYQTGIIAVAVVCLITGLFILKQMLPNTSDPIEMDWLFLSIPILFLYLFFILKLPVLTAIENFSFDLKSIFQFLAITIGFGILMWAWKHSIANLELYSTNAISSVYLSFLRGVQKPGISLIGHIIYYGPLTLFIIVFWKNLSLKFKEMNLPFVVIILLHLILAVNSESRFLTMAIPFLLFWIMPVAESLKNRMQWIMIFFLIGLLSSKIWLPINTNLTAENWQEKADMFFINFGPWMKNYYYFILLISSAITITLLFLIKKYFTHNAVEQDEF
ncbi:MAG TPA: hypothetical protein VFM99_04385 [Chitinophagales bacterium]|nr:hypothetical protein [Chitinophagales bacterium]